MCAPSCSLNVLESDLPLTAGGSSFSQYLHFTTQVVWLELLQVKTEAKKLLSTSAFSMSQATGLMFPSGKGPHSP